MPLPQGIRNQIVVSQISIRESFDSTSKNMVIKEVADSSHHADQRQSTAITVDKINQNDNKSLLNHHDSLVNIDARESVIEH